LSKSEVSAQSASPSKGRRRLTWAVTLCLPAGLIVGGIAGAWFGNVRIGLALGAAVGFCLSFIFLAAIVVSVAMRA